MVIAVLIDSEVILMVIYDRLWETMKTKGISQYRLMKYYGISAGQIGRLKKNSYVSTHTIDVLCTILNCRVEDVMEFRLDTVQHPRLGIDPAVAHQQGNEPHSKQAMTPAHPGSAEQRKK